MSSNPVAPSLDSTRVCCCSHELKAQRESWYEMFTATNGVRHLRKVLVRGLLRETAPSPWLFVMRNKCIGLLCKILSADVIGALKV